MTPQIQQIFGGLFLVLVLATAWGWWWHRSRPSPAITNLNLRIRAWWVMIAVGAVALLIGRGAIVLMFALLSWAALREFAAADPSGPPSAWYFVTIPGQYLAFGLGWQWPALLAIPLAGLAWKGQRWNWHRWFGQLLCVYGLSFVAALEQTEWMLYLVLIAQASDVLQYVWGRAIGRYPIAPRISPAKTVEGLVGGVTSATALGIWLYELTPFGPLGAMWTALLICGTGFASGLVLSAIKRRRQIKDWGSAIAGHGGVLDRVDSLCLSAPAFFCLTHLIGR